MPLPIVHLGVAKEMIEKLNITDIPAFYLGTISPDAVHMRNHSKKEDKNISHLRNADMENRKNNAKSFILNNSSTGNRGF